VHQSLIDRNPAGEIVLSLASFEGVRKLTQLEINRPPLFPAYKQARKQLANLRGRIYWGNMLLSDKRPRHLFKY
jgi:hypothetical protein